MKVKEFENDVDVEMAEDEKQEVISLVKNSKRKLKAAKKTLKEMEKAHLELMETDVDDLELDRFEY